jgi:ATP-dependent RNA helicase DeaD
MAKKEETKKPRKSLFGLSPRLEVDLEPEAERKPAEEQADKAPETRTAEAAPLEGQETSPAPAPKRSRPRRRRSRKKDPARQQETSHAAAEDQGQPATGPELAPESVEEAIPPQSTAPVEPEPPARAVSAEPEPAPATPEPAPEPKEEPPLAGRKLEEAARHARSEPLGGEEPASAPDPSDRTGRSDRSDRAAQPDRQARPGRQARHDNQEGVIEPKSPLPEIQLEQLPEEIRLACARTGWKELTPVQSRAIPYLFAGRDVMVQSRTGSGKTGAFILPLIELLDKERPGPQALVLVPTRELAAQVEESAHTLFGDQGLRSVAVYGGVSYGPQLEAFRKGVHLVVGTPGRILDHLLKRTLSLDGLRVLIFDEADRMLSMGFYPDMQRISKYLPNRPVRGSMFSATYPPHVVRLAQEFLNAPEMLSLSRDQVHVAEIDHVFSVVPPMEKDRALVRFVELENPASAIIFCNTKSDVHYVTVVLQRFGHNADELSSDLVQNKRASVLENLRTGRTRYLVATDVAARGIDIPEISHIFQYGPPEDPELYIHRAGRTGRAGASGKAVTLVSGMEKIELQRIAQKFGIDMREVEMPTEEQVSAMVSERMIALLEAKLRTRDRIHLERLRRFVPLVRELGRQEEDPLVLALLLDEIYQASLHAALDTPVAKTEERPRAGEPNGEERKGKGRKRRPRRRKSHSKEGSQGEGVTTDEGGSPGEGGTPGEGGE